ncbi:homoserine dehydrogenase [Ihubacter sp. mB4P-1]|uniref:homoserine dehydrogenase n=1 Tax=Ihubacter sp. mB4P-1 TaxID=3242370 RepID=UPI00137B2F11
MNDLRLAILGFGNAGQAFARLLSDKEDEIRRLYGRGVRVTAIVTRSKGTIVDASGIDIDKACDDLEVHGHFADNTPGLCRKEAFDVLAEAEYDAVCELTPLNIFTGQPAIDHIRMAFSRGKHVISANKGPIAWAFDELSALAAEKGCMFFYETTVMDGTPVFNLVEHTLKLCRITKVSGILNSTTNYILEELAAGKDYEDILAAGKKLGFIEADPSMDIDGYDAAAKVTALLNVLMHAHLTPDQVERKGIGNITAQDIKDAADRGKVIKLLCEGSLQPDGNVSACVKPVEVDKGDMLSAIDSTTSVVSITTDLMGKLSVIEHEPEIEQTAYGIFGDVLRVLEGEI